MFLEKCKSINDYLRFGKSGQKKRGFGTFYGVYLPGVLTMFGVIIYLRLGYILGCVGIAQTLLIVSLSCFIVFITVLSISSSATNMEVKGGGTYYMISRSLGIEVGSAVGVPLFIAQTLSISFCAMGFAESIQPFCPGTSLQAIGVVSICILMLLAYFSAGAALNFQFLIMLIILGSMISLFLGKSMLEVEETANVYANPVLPFWACFAIFFPAATGVEAGVSMSGDLHSPRKALPIGSIAVVLTGFLVYLLIPLFLDAHVSRHLLLNEPLVVQQLSRFKSLIIAGIWAATLSSALGGLLAAPRTFQALAKDGVFPGIFAKEFGKGREPRAATLLCFGIALLGVYYGSIDKIAPVLSMFYLIAYAVLNLATGLEGLMGNPSWRPTFRVPWHVSMLGVVLCMMAMLMIDAGATFTALFFVVLVYLYMRRRKYSGDWEDIRHGFLMFLSRFAIYRLANSRESIRSWRPNFIVFSDTPAQVSNLINLTSAMTRDKGFLTLVSVFPPTLVDQERADRWKVMVNNYLREKNIEALIEFSIDENIILGAKKFLANYGIGAISPNTVVLGEAQKRENLGDFLTLIQLSCQSKKNVVIIREKNTIQPVTKKIDIWWDDASRCNSELMILLGHMLSLSKYWKGSNLRIKSLVPNEGARKSRREYFHKFFESNRLPFETKIYVKDSDSQSSFDFITQISKVSDLALIGMRPFKSDETLEEYEEYYLNVFNSTSRIDNAVFVIGSEHIELKGLFN